MYKFKTYFYAIYKRLDVNNSVPIETISKMLGHSRIQTTQIYVRVLDKKVEHDMGKLNAKFNF